MSSPRRGSPLALSLVLPLALAALWPAGISAQDALPLDETRGFFQDVDGYHAQGQAQAEERVEAERLAKAAALTRLFREIGKDEIFAQMTISGWPELISVEETVTAEADGVTLARVQVAVAVSAVMLTEQKYQVAVAELLDRTETVIDALEQELEQADDHERNLRTAEALVSFRRARGRVLEARELVRGVGDKSVSSGGGSTIVALTTRVDAAVVRIEDGLERIESVELETRQAVAADEMTKAVDMFEAEIRELEDRSQESLEASPFYDLPSTRLKVILAELGTDLEKARTITQELEGISEALPEDRVYLRQRTDLALADVRAMAGRLERMSEEASEELELPRLVRQERARRARATLDALGAGLRYAFLHKPTDTVAVEWVLPLSWDMESPVRGTDLLNLSLRAEGVFGGGLWVRGSVGHDDVIGGALDATWRSSAWRSTFDLGFGKTAILGLGVSWDWVRVIGDGAAERELGVSLHVGGLDEERRRVSWLLSLGYAVPMVSAGVIVIPYHLNASLGLMIKAGDVLILRAHARSKAWQYAPLVDAFTEAFAYRFDWQAGVGLRLPPPFVVTLAYGGQVTGALAPQGVTAADPHVGGWTVSLGYVF